MNRLTIQQIAIPLAFVAFIAINFLATPFSGTEQTTVEEVFEETLNVLINPAPFAIVAIWFFVIFPGLGAFSFFQARVAQRENPLVRPIRNVVILNFLLNSAWVLTTQAQNFALLNLINVGLYGTALYIVIRLHRPTGTTLTRGERWCVVYPFSAYLAWLSVANIVTAAGLLTDAGWNGFGINAVAWTVIMMGVAALLGAIFLFVRRDIPFVLIVVYALTAIMLAQPAPGAITVAWAVLSLALIAAVIVFIRSGRDGGGGAVNRRDARLTA
jgi:hypothetical protein